MLSWVSSIFNSQDGADGDKGKYGFQMSLTLSTHPFLDEYREGVRARELEFMELKRNREGVDFEQPRGRQNYPTVIVRSNESVSAIQTMICKTEPFHNEKERVMDALTDTTYHGQTLYMKDEKCKEVDPTLFKPFKFGPEYSFSFVSFKNIFWNVPFIFIGFDREKHGFIEDMFSDILNWNPIGKNITFIEFLEYMSQPVVFWIRTKNEIKQNLTYYWSERGLFDRDHDLLEYRIMSNITVQDKIFKMLRDSYLEMMGRQLLDPSGQSKHMLLA